MKILFSNGNTSGGNNDGNYDSKNNANDNTY